MKLKKTRSIKNNILIIHMERETDTSKYEYTKAIMDGFNSEIDF